ncbi:MAG: tetratricopeptide repeat protein [Treponema sp.]|nr:tetratricopeptide repeat protein [Treponema sp.]
MKMNCKKYIFAATLLSLILLSSCGSKPKRTMVINTVSTSAGTMIENARASLAASDFEKAHYFLDNAWRMAMSVDNNELLLTVCLTRISAYLSQEDGSLEEARNVLLEAKTYASYTQNVERSNALISLSQVRIALAEKNTDYASLISILDQNKSKVSDDLYESAQFESLKADVYKAQGKYADAESYYQAALEVFTKECYLSELGVNYYKLSQVRSLSGNKNGALEALEMAIKYDRDEENSRALASDYYVKGILLMKDNPSKEDKIAAEYAFKHSADIYNASDLPELAEKSLDKWESYK